MTARSTRCSRTTKVATFVKALDKAEALEERGQFGSSLAWYLKARNEHPASMLAGDGIQRVVASLRPGGAGRRDSSDAASSGSDGPGEFGANGAGDDFDSF